MVGFVLPTSSCSLGSLLTQLSLINDSFLIQSILQDLPTKHMFFDLPPSFFSLSFLCKVYIPQWLQNVDDLFLSFSTFPLKKMNGERMILMHCLHFLMKLSFSFHHSFSSLIVIKNEYYHHIFYCCNFYPCIYLCDLIYSF